MHVLLIDNQTHVRASLEFLLDQQPGIDVVGAADATTMLLKQTYAPHPTIILIGWELWHSFGTELLKTLSTLDVPPKVIVFSSRPELQQVALQSGADAFFSAYDPPEIFLQLLQRFSCTQGRDMR